MITILLPVYNDEEFLAYTIKSILNQDFVDYKCLIAFNGTIDSSREIAKFLIGDDNRFNIIDYGKDKGKAKTLNKLLSIVDTKYISLIDGDDLWEKNKLKLQIEICEDFDVIGTLAYYIDIDNNRTNALYLDQNDIEIRSGFSLGHNQIINSSSLFRTSDAIEIGGWDETVEGMEDFDFWIRLSKKNKTFHNIQKILVSHRIHSKSNFNAKQLPFTIQDILNKNKYLYQIKK
jgi:glycosyltransferase involved in cell wall biosynthesis